VRAGRFAGAVRAAGAHRARAGLRSAHFVAPQYWAWAPWRVRAYREAFERALTILPFEPPGTRVTAWRTRTSAIRRWTASRRAAPEDPRRTTLVLLPGSRRAVVARNLPWMLAVAGEIHRRHPELEIVLPHERADLGPESRPRCTRPARPAGCASRWASCTPSWRARAPPSRSRARS
jgi:lipid-A-disaccharide synthase